MSDATNLTDATINLMHAIASYYATPNPLAQPGTANAIWNRKEKCEREFREAVEAYQAEPMTGKR